MSEVISRTHFDGRTLIRERVQDVEPILERNAMLRGMEQKSDWGRHTATIPNVIYERWFNEEYARGNVSLRLYSKQMDEIVARKLKDPEWAFLRVDNPSNPFYVGWGS
jgi:hypothetical protein